MENQKEQEVDDAKRKLIVWDTEIETSRMIAVFGVVMIILVFVLKWI